MSAQAKDESGYFGARRWWLWLVILLLILWVITRLNFLRLMAVLANLSGLEIGLILLVNMAVLLALSSRWWLILFGNGWRLNYLLVSAYRLAGFSLSYFTPGPQFGGEPLLIQLLRKRHGIPGKAAGASVVLDKSLELAVNFGFLVFGVAVSLSMGLFPLRYSWLLLLASVALLLAPASHLILASRGYRPLAAAFALLPANWRSKPRLARLIALVDETEFLLAQYLTARPGWIALALLTSLISWLFLVAEYWLMAQFLGLSIPIWMAIASLTAARLAILLPSPGGLGTLEASQILAFSALAQSPEAGAALALVIRARDLAFGGLGLLLVGHFGGGLIARPSALVGGRKHRADGPEK